MIKHKKEDRVPRLYSNLVATIALFDTLLETKKKEVTSSIINRAMMRRLRVSFLALYEYLREKTAIPSEYSDKPLEDIADYFIKHGCFEEGDKEEFLNLGSIYTAIRWSAPGNSPDEAKIMGQVEPVYEFLKKIVASHQIVEQAPVKEATSS